MAIHDGNSIARRGEQQASVAIAFLTATWVFVVLRVWTRTYVIANFGWDDGTMVLATIIFTIYCATMLYIESNGGGTHISSVTEMVKLTKVSTSTILEGQTDLPPSGRLWAKQHTSSL